MKPQLFSFTHPPTCMVVSMPNGLGVSGTERLWEAER